MLVQRERGPPLGKRTFLDFFYLSVYLSSRNCNFFPQEKFTTFLDFICGGSTKTAQSTPKKHLFVSARNLFLGYQLAFISYKKLFECTAMHLATWKPDFSGVHLMPQIEGKSLSINRTLALCGSLNFTQQQFLQGLISWNIYFWPFTDVVIQIEYSYKKSVSIKRLKKVLSRQKHYKLSRSLVKQFGKRFTKS